MFTGIKILGICLLLIVAIILIGGIFEVVGTKIEEHREKNRDHDRTEDIFFDWDDEDNDGKV